MSDTGPGPALPEAASRGGGRTPLAGVLLALVGLLGCVAVVGTADATPAKRGPHARIVEVDEPPDCNGEAPPKADGTRWTCTFSDEFDGDELDRENWGVVRTADSGYTIGSECYLDRRDVVDVDRGVLSLTVRRTDQPFRCVSSSRGTSYPSQAMAGSVTTMKTFTQTYGRYQIRARFPDARVAGLHSALWLFPEKISRVAAGGNDYGEIDIAEFYTRYPDRVIPYLHYQESGWFAQETTDNDCLVTHPEAFHTYTLEWTPQAISIWYDDALCLQNTNWTPRWPLRHPAPFDKPFALLLTQGLGVQANAPTAQTPLPATMQVDWVRVWR